MTEQQRRMIRSITHGVFCSLLVFMIFISPRASVAQSNDSRQQLIERFRTNSKSDHKAAYEAAKEFFQKYPDDTSEDAQFMKRWMAAYEKVEMNGQPSSSSGNQLTSNSGGSSPPAETETPEIAEARIAVTKYKDYQGAIKSLESSSSETKRKPLWLFYMAIAQEGVGNIKEALKNLEQYNVLVPNQKAIVEKIAELRYKVRKLEEEENREKETLNEESRFGALPQTLIWLKTNGSNSSSGENKYVDFQGTTMIWSSCSADRLKREDCRMYSVPLTLVDISNIDEIGGSGSDYIVDVYCMYDRKDITVQRTYKGKTNLDLGDRHDHQFHFDSRAAAHSFAVALRHAVKLIRQGQ